MFLGKGAFWPLLPIGRILQTYPPLRFSGEGERNLCGQEPGKILRGLGRSSCLSPPPAVAHSWSVSDPEEAPPVPAPARPHFALRFLGFFAAPATDYSAGCWLFLRLLGLCHVFAFLSLWHQLDGLIGEHGIVSATQWLDAVAKQIGPDRFWKVPTLCWLDPSDAFRHTLCAAGSALGLALTLGLAPRLTLCLLWALYLSLCSVGGVFLGFQWDALLLESTFLAVFIAPRNWLPTLPGLHPAPRRLALLAVWWLLFRLMLLSGAVKVLSKDKLWAGLSALGVHFETQPLPTPLSWWAHHLPQPLLTGSCALMFVIELAFPFLLLCGRPGRRTAALAFISLMGLIALTGNYCFFNLLVIALSLPLLDNAFLQRLAPALRLETPDPPLDQPARPASFPWLALATAPLLLLGLWCAAVQTAATLFQIRAMPRWAAAPVEWVAPFRTINNYGLFAVMTKTRPEIILEGSADGRSWKEYVFKWKAGPTGVAPRFVAPYQPRLDWQMWFAALGELRQNPWLSNLMIRILQGEPAALDLLGVNPFTEKPPRFLRAALFQYKFSTPEEKASSGNWWERSYQGDYCPPISLDGRRP